MRLVFGVIVFLGAIVYNIAAYYLFEAEVKKEKVVRQEVANKTMIKSFVSAFIVGISPTIMIGLKIEFLGEFIMIQLFWLVISVWTLTKSTRNGISRLESKYDKI